MVPEHPPTDPPPVILSIEYRDLDAGPYAVNAEVAGGRLLVRATSPDTLAGVPAHDRTFRDVLLDTRLSLVAGGEDTVYGVYVRQVEAARYVGWGMTPTGRILGGVVADNAWHTMADAGLAPDLSFNGGLGQPNRFQVLAFGPALVFVLNGAIVTGITVDARFKEGYLGYWLLRGQQVGEAIVAADWLQVRAVLPGQPPTL